MTDIHCHIVPGVDDGAYDLGEALAMAKLAAGAGVTTIVATPHFEGVPESLEELPHILRQFRRLRDAVRKSGIGVEVVPGVEVLCLPETMEMARNRQLPTLGKTRYVLMEFYFDASWEFMDSALEGLREFGYDPVVAHPERYAAIQRDIRLAQSWFDRGFVLQVNKGSILGAFGSRVQDTAVRMLYRGVAHVVASDAHSSQVRTTDLEPVEAWCLAHLGREYTRILLEDNPGRIVSGKPMRPVAMEE